MTPLQAIKTGFRKSFTFSGRATLGEFWCFILFMVIGTFLLLIIKSIIFGPEITVTYNADSQGNPIGNPIAIEKTYTSGIFGDIFFLICALPWIAVTWRRMHDTGRPGYLPFLTLLGWIILGLLILIAHTGISDFFSGLAQNRHVSFPVSGYLIGAFFMALVCVLILNTHWLATPSEPTTNKYGPNPSEVIQ